MKKSYEIKESTLKQIEFEAERLGISPNKYVNLCLETFSSLPGDIRYNLSKTALTEMTKSYLELEEETKYGFTQAYIHDSIERYEKVLRFLNDYKELPIDKKSMTLIGIADGYVTFPESWIVVNKEDAKKCHYAYVVEIMTQQIMKVPHFIGFVDKPINTLSQEEQNDIYDACEKVCPDFSKFREANKNITLNNDMSNLKEWTHKPVLGIFSVSDYGDPYGIFPYGTMIVRREEVQ